MRRVIVFVWIACLAGVVVAGCAKPQMIYGPWQGKADAGNIPPVTINFAEDRTFTGNFGTDVSGTWDMTERVVKIQIVKMDGRDMEAVQDRLKQQLFIDNPHKDNTQQAAAIDEMAQQTLLLSSDGKSMTAAINGNNFTFTKVAATAS